MQPGRTTCNRLLKRGGEPTHRSSHMYLPTYVPSAATTQQAMTMTDQVHSGPCLQAQLNQLEYKLPAASVPGHLWSFSTVRQNQ